MIASATQASLSMMILGPLSSTSFPEHRTLHNPSTGTITHPLLSHAAHLARRRLELSAPLPLPPRPSVSRHTQQQMGALYQGYGTHYVDLWLGSPSPQRQTVIVDTGSGVTAFPCEECSGCGDAYHTDSYFRESESETFRALACGECHRGSCADMKRGKQCKISMSYAEGSSWSAYEGVDVCYAGGLHDRPLEFSQGDGSKVDHIDPVQASQFSFELAFGCQVSITGLFITQLADGIMGMENDDTSFWKQMYTKGAIPRPEFSLCFSRQDDASREGTGAGAMTLGGVDPRLHSSPMVYATNSRSTGFYSVHVKAMYLREGGGVSAQIGDVGKLHRLDVSEATLNSGSVIVDSGTTDSYFTRALASSFNSAWKKVMGNDYNHNAVTLTEKDIAVLPTIIIVIEGHKGGVGDETSMDPNEVPGYVGDAFDEFSPRDIVLAIPGSHYMEFDPESGKYVARFYTDEGSGSVLGANAMMGHDIYFDTTNNRIGFAESDCDYNALLMKEGKSISVAPQIVSTKTEVPPDKEMPQESVTEGGSEDDEEYDDDKAKVVDEPSKDSGGSASKYSDMTTNLLNDMKHECSSASCRGVAASLIIAAALIVILIIRRNLARRRVVRQYQEAELEISDLALDSDSEYEEGGRYEDAPPSLPRIS